MPSGSDVGDKGRDPYLLESSLLLIMH